ncbi:MAG: hypothetical protein RBU27_13190 [Bacteroidota bacterium]|jgi:hypothetical protein|nr:hypothetical protein [Bacteroidota bacterium]
MLRLLFLSTIALMLTAPLRAQMPDYPVDDERSRGVPGEVPAEVQFIGYLFTRFSATNVAPTNELLRGQIIGRLFGGNTTTTLPRTAVYGESRFVPLFVYRPAILDGAAVFRGLFKVDMTWGDANYGVGNNTGGAISGATVNIQTLMANVELRPAHTWNVVVGLQRIFDNVRDPNVTALGVHQTSGNRLMYWGTQGIGVSSYLQISPITDARLSYYQLYENQIQVDDDVVLWMADLETQLHPLVELGGSAWYVRDRGAGSGGVSVLGQGFNSTLVDYNGGARLQLDNPKYQADVFWLGANTAYNREFTNGRWWASAMAMANLGSIDTVGADGTTAPRADLFGVTGHASLYYKFGQTANDRIGLEALYTTGDADGAADGQYDGVVTGNTWGSPVGIYSSHRAYLLFPDPQVINRYYSAVHDISNLGYGTRALFLNYHNDVIPNKLAMKLGAAAAFANETPRFGGDFIGYEVNAEFKYHYGVFLTFGLHMAYMVPGDFYDSPFVRNSATPARPADPWVMFASLAWMMF